MTKGLREDTAEKPGVSPTANTAVAACTPVTLALSGGKLNLVTATQQTTLTVCRTL